MERFTHVRPSSRAVLLPAIKNVLGDNTVTTQSLGIPLHLKTCKDIVNVKVMVNLSEEGLPEPVERDVPVLCIKSLLAYLFSDQYGVSISRDSLMKFWNHATQFFEWGASHPGKFTHIPLAVYGDGARYTNSTGFVEKVLCVLVNMPLWAPRSTRTSRYLLFSIRESCMDSYRTTLWPVYAHLAHQLNELFADGIDVPGSSPTKTLKFCLTEIRGDWSWHCDSLQLKPRWNSLSCCYKCPASRRADRYQFTNYTETAAWIGEEFTHAHFISHILKPGRICPLDPKRMFMFFRFYWHPTEQLGRYKFDPF